MRLGGRIAALAVAALALLRAPLPADRFDDSLAAANANLAAPGGREHAQRVAARFEEAKLREALDVCRDSAKEEDLGPFIVLMELRGDGRPEQVLLRPPGPVAVCLRWTIRETSFPRPPSAGWWVSTTVEPKRAAGAPPIPTPGVATATVPPTRTPAAPPASASPSDIVDFGAGATPIRIGDSTSELAALRRRLQESRATVVGPIHAQSGGVALDDPRLEPYWTLAEELGLPALVPLGVEAPGSDPTGDRYRVSLGDPLKLEAALVRHPKLILIVSGAAWPMGDAMTALMWKYPRVYADTSVIAWWLPRREFHSYLRRLLDANLGEQILFASGASTADRLAKAVDAVQSAEFLTPAQKQAILRGNAERLRKSPEN